MLSLIPSPLPLPPCPITATSINLSNATYQAIAIDLTLLSSRPLGQGLRANIVHNSTLPNCHRHVSVLGNNEVVAMLVMVVVMELSLLLTTIGTEKVLLRFLLRFFFALQVVCGVIDECRESCEFKGLCFGLARRSWKYDECFFLAMCFVA